MAINAFTILFLPACLAVAVGTMLGLGLGKLIQGFDRTILGGKAPAPGRDVAKLRPRPRPRGEASRRDEPTGIALAVRPTGCERLDEMGFLVDPSTFAVSPARWM